MKNLKGWLSAKDKPLRRVLLGVVIAVVVAGVIWGTLTLVKTARRKAVNVYPVNSFSMTEYWGDSSETSGTVTTDKLQKVFISNTQNVKQIFVEEGQTVRKGDKLIAYDTTLSDLSLQRAQIAVDQAALAVTAAQAQLATLQKSNDLAALYKTKSDLKTKLQKAKDDYGDYNAGTLPALPCGDGSNLSPRYVDASGYLMASRTDVPNLSALKPLLGVSRDYYVVLVTVSDGRYIGYTGLHLMGDGAGGMGYETFEATELTPEGVKDTTLIKNIQRQLDSVEKLISSSLTPIELIKQENQLRQTITEKEVNVKLAKLDLQKKQKEVSNGIVYSEIDGTVKAVRDAKEAYTAGQPVVEVSGGGGYYITGTVSELALDTVSIGQTVQVNSWMNGATCEGEIVEIGEYPSSSNGWGGDGNNNVSWYPLKVFVSEEANLQEGDGVSMTYQSAGAADGGWYLQSMFIRSENGRSYVLVRGKDGRLEQRFLQTGRDLWGSYTQITGGDLTQDDFMAFPYGSDAVAGAQTKESTMDEFYMSAY